MHSKEVEKLLKGGNNTATVSAKAEVCTHCGERLYSKEQIVSFEEIRKKLAPLDAVIRSSYNFRPKDVI